MTEPQTDTKNELLDSLLGDFLDESDQLLTQLNTNLLQLDEWVQALDEGHQQRCDESLLNEMFRAAHSLKGLSGMLGLTDINHLVHKIENVFDAARHDQLCITRDVTELIFMGLDQLTAMVGLLKDPAGEPVDCDAVLESIRRLLQKAGAERKQTTQVDAERALAAVVAEDSAPRGTGAPHPDKTRQVDPLKDIKDEDDIPDSYLSIFVDEVDTSLDALTSGLLALEGDSGRGSETAIRGDLKGLLSTAHKIKGSSAAIGLNRAAKLAHLMEDLLENVVAGGGALSPQAIDVLLRCTDGLRQFVVALRNGSRTCDHLGPLAQGVVALQARSAQERDRQTTYLGEVIFQPNLPAAGLKAQLIYEKLIKIGAVCDCQPSPETLDEIETLECLRFRLTTDQSQEAVLRQVRVGGVLRANVEPLDVAAEKKGPPQACPDHPEATAATKPCASHEKGPSPSSPPPSAPLPGPQTPLPEAGQRTTTTGQRPTETVRVDTDRLDQLMDLAGQLVINRAQFSQIGERLKAVADCSRAAGGLDKLSTDLDKLGGHPPAGHGTLRGDGQHLAAELASVRGHARRIQNELEAVRREVQTLARARDAVRDLFEAIHQLGRVCDGIQKGVMDIRMVPIGPLFARFHRVVRDISRASAKQIRLEIAGEKTELDKRMIDELGDPLVHLVRNSADHGIEPPEEREAAGKPRQGTVTLDAFHRGNSIVIEVRDDGKGLDTDRILHKALEKGLVSEADAQRMTTRQIQQLIWQPGLSTAAKVTDISGRGMGMDIVKAKIEELSGTVEISSQQGRGTTITIKLPLTLAILPSLMVQIAGDTFAMPMETVTEIVSVGRNQVRTVRGRPVATVRGRVVSLVRLGELLSFHRTGDSTLTDQISETTLVIVSDAGEEIGLAVDRVLGEEDVVIKSLAENYENLAGIAGASILGDGRVALILDIPALIAGVSRKAARVTS